MSAELLAALRALVEAVIRPLKKPHGVTWCKVCERTWSTQFPEHHAERCSVPAARAALERVESLQAHYDAAMFNWDEVITERDTLKARLAKLEAALDRRFPDRRPGGPR